MLPRISSSACLVALLAPALVACTQVGPATDATASESADISIREQRGVDSATAFSAGDAKKLKDEHGVEWTGVYIGGKCSGGAGWDRDVVASMVKAAGFTFMPTYVGQEAAASCDGSKPVLTEAQGKADGHHAAALMGTYGWDAKRDIPVALDIEQDTYEGSPHDTVEYVRGWISQVRSEGYVPYVYANPDAVNAFAAAKLDIAGVWVASYFYKGFESVTPYDLHQIGDHFTKNDRAWQYAGDVWVSSIGTHLDLNASDLALAPKPGGTNLSPPETIFEKIVQTALANVGKGACSKNSTGSRDFDSSCTGNDGHPEYWCADFARWVWAHAGAKDVDQLDAAAGSFYTYGEKHGTVHKTAAVGDAVVFDYKGGGVADHVALVTKVESDGRIETVSGDWNGESGSEAHFSSTSHVDLNAPAYTAHIGDEPGVIGMKISGFISPVH
jgi:hypothetical protein